MKSPSSVARTRRAGQATEARILEAAEEIFARYGFEGARMEQVAERAGVEKANIYYYFKGKDQLYRALMDRVMSEMVGEISALLTVAVEREPLDQLDDFLELFFKLVSRYQGLVALAFGEMLHPPRKKQARSPVFKMLEQIESVGAHLINEGVKAGVFREQDAAQTVITLEGAIFHYFFLPEERIANLTGGKRFDPENLARRKQALRQHILLLLQK